MVFHLILFWSKCAFGPFVLSRSRLILSSAYPHKLTFIKLICSHEKESPKVKIVFLSSKRSPYLSEWALDANRPNIVLEKLKDILTVTFILAF